MVISWKFKVNTHDTFEYKIISTLLRLTTKERFFLSDPSFKGLPSSDPTNIFPITSLHSPNFFPRVEDTKFYSPWVKVVYKDCIVIVSLFSNFFFFFLPVRSLSSPLSVLKYITFFFLHRANSFRPVIHVPTWQFEIMFIYNKIFKNFNPGHPLLLLHSIFLYSSCKLSGLNPSRKKSPDILDTQKPNDKIQKSSLLNLGPEKNKEFFFCLLLLLFILLFVKVFNYFSPWWHCDI